MNDADFHWLVGILEGEGSFMKSPPSDPNSPRVTVNMTDEDVIARVAAIFKRKYQFVKAREEHHKHSYRVVLTGLRAADFMVQLRPFMGLRRQGQIDAALATFDILKMYNRKVTVDQAAEIKARFRDGERADALGTEFGITKWAVYAIHQERWNQRRPKSKPL